jgi:hypothetical protein
MTPSQAIVKNCVLIAVCFFMKKYLSGYDYGRFGKWLFIGICVTGLGLPFILNTVDLDFSYAYINRPANNFKLELDSLYKDAKMNTPPKDLTKGRKIIAFLSAECPHCRIAGKKIALLKRDNPELPFYIVINGTPDEIHDFFNETHANTIPFCQLNGRNFIYLAGTHLPMIYLVRNSVVENNINYFQINADELHKWVRLP